jgi:cation:H+ antiporter
VVGSNIANIGLILGVSGIITTLSVERHIMHKEFPFILFAPIVLFTLGFDGVLTRLDGFILIFIAVIFYSLFIKRIREGKFKRILEEITEEAIHKKRTYTRHLLSIIAGLVGIIIGAKLTVDYASAIARGIHIPEIIIGISLVAVGTSLPEFVTSITAAMKKNQQLSLGNIVGSNVLNIFVILGVATLLHPITVPESMFWFHIPAMLVFSLLLCISLLKYRKLQRREAIILFVLYILYIGYSFYKF